MVWAREGMCVRAWVCVFVSLTFSRILMYRMENTTQFCILHIIFYRFFNAFTVKLIFSFEANWVQILFNKITNYGYMYTHCFERIFLIQLVRSLFNHNIWKPKERKKITLSSICNHVSFAHIAHTVKTTLPYFLFVLVSFFERKTKFKYVV